MINDEKDYYLMNALNLAFVGDAVFTMEVRKHIVNNTAGKLNTINKLSNSIVKAPTQAKIMEKLLPTLTERELEIAMRARNSHLAGHKAKNSTLEEYSLATQFEAVIGFWFLTGENGKISAVLENYVWEML